MSHASSVQAIVQPYGPVSSHCGYCNRPGSTSRQEASLTAFQVSCDLYQRMIDRGWRRSGTYCYKPDLRTSCCPQYTIKLEAMSFKASKSQRKLVNRWSRHVVGEGATESEAKVLPHGKSPHQAITPSRRKAVFELEDSLHASETTHTGDAQVAHKFEVTLEPSSFTEEKFALFQSYEAHIHGKHGKTRSNFKHFLVESPLHPDLIPYHSPPPSHLPTHYGPHHQLYRLDGRLIGMGVIDILPSCVSSVYFMWEKEFEKFSLGKLSALREISLAREIHEAGVPSVQYLYMGYYIHTCQKMKYKGEYSPSHLADPEDWSWHPLPKCQALLDKNRYACFTHPEHSVAGSAVDNIAEAVATEEIPDEDLAGVYLLQVMPDTSRPSAIPVTMSNEWTVQEHRRDIRAVVTSLGIELANDIIFYV